VSWKIKESKKVKRVCGRIVRLIEFTDDIIINFVRYEGDSALMACGYAVDAFIKLEPLLSAFIEVDFDDACAPGQGANGAGVDTGSAFMAYSFNFEFGSVEFFPLGVLVIGVRVSVVIGGIVIIRGVFINRRSPRVVNKIYDQ